VILDQPLLSPTHAPGVTTDKRCFPTIPTPTLADPALEPPARTTDLVDNPVLTHLWCEMVTVTLETFNVHNLTLPHCLILLFVVAVKESIGKQRRQN